MVKNDKNIRLTVILGIIIVVVILIYYNSSLNSPTKNQNVGVIEQKEKEIIQKEEKIIIVHISGEVAKPGIVKIKSGQRLYEALELVGGSTQNADVDKVNLAMILEDQQKIVIPPKLQTTGSSQVEQQDEKINLNTADKSDLMTLPSIGETIADNILQYREENSGFKNIEELKNVSRIGDATFEKLKDLITCY